MATDLGIDLYCDTDFRRDMPTVSGRLCFAQALARRLQTPAGRFSWLDRDGVTVRGWPNYGTDLRGFLLSKSSVSTIAAAAEAECLKDERVQAADVAVEYASDGQTASLAITIAITELDGTDFVFTLAITDAALTLVSLEGQAL